MQEKYEQLKRSLEEIASSQSKPIPIKTALEQPAFNEKTVIPAKYGRTNFGPPKSKKISTNTINLASTVKNDPYKNMGKRMKGVEQVMIQSQIVNSTPNK